MPYTSDDQPLDAHGVETRHLLARAGGEKGLISSGFRSSLGLIQESPPERVVDRLADQPEIEGLAQHLVRQRTELNPLGGAARYGDDAAIANLDRRTTDVAARSCSQARCRRAAEHQPRHPPRALASNALPHQIDCTWPR